MDRIAQRLQKLPTYVFAQLDHLKVEERAKGVDLIDLGMGNPDVPPPPEVIEEMSRAIKDPANSRYPGFEGIPAFRIEVARWCEQQYGISIKSETEVVPLIGSKEGLVHLAFAYINPGDTTLVPMPAYPAHFRGTILAGGTPVVIPSSKRTGYLPNLAAIDDHIAQQAKLMILSYPTNPTAATVPIEVFEEAVAFAKHHDLILVHDFAYAEVYFDGKKPPSILSVKGAKDVAVEFHTFSKSFGMAGWRSGFCVGNADIIKVLYTMKTNLDYGLFMSVQLASIKALQTNKKYLDDMRATYQRRRDLFSHGLEEMGWKIKKPKATMYLWIPVPEGYTSTSFSLHVMNKTGVVFAPGIAFGEVGDGYIRIALVENESRLREAIARMKKAGIEYHGDG